MPAKVTRSAQPATGPVHPERKRAKIVGLPASDNFVPAGSRVHGEWMPWFLRVMRYGSFTALLLSALWGFTWLDRTVKRAEVAIDYCTRPLLKVPEYVCPDTALNCYTVPQQAVIAIYEEQTRKENAWRAEHCLPVMTH